MISNLEGILINQYKQKLMSEQVLESIQTKYDLLNKHLQEDLERERNEENEDHILKALQDKIACTKQKMIDENDLKRNQIQSIENQFENLNKMVIDNDNTMKMSIKSIEDKIYNRTMIDDNNLMKNNLESIENQVLKLNQNIDEYKKQIIINSAEGNKKEIQINNAESNLAGALPCPQINSAEENKENKQININTEKVNRNKKVTNTSLGKEKRVVGPINRDNTRNIWDAIDKGNVSALKFWIAKNPKNLLKTKKFEYLYLPPLHYAAFEGQLEIVKYLISYGLEIDLLDVNNTTPLFWALSSPSPSIINYLLDNGANINHRTNDGWTALHSAVRLDDLPVTKLLVKRGADKTIKTSNNETALDLAKRMCLYSIIKCLSSC